MFLKYKLKFLSLLPPLSLSGGVKGSASFSIVSSFVAPQFIHVYILIPVDEVVGDSVIIPPAYTQFAANSAQIQPFGQLFWYSV